MVVLLLIHCLLLLPFFFFSFHFFFFLGGGGGGGGVVFGPCLVKIVVLSVLSSFAIISLRKREGWLLYFNCVLAVMSLLCSVLCLFLTVPQFNLSGM